MTWGDTFVGPHKNYGNSYSDIGPLFVLPFFQENNLFYA